MRRTSFAVSALAGLAVLAASPQLVQAQITVGPSVAFHDDADFGVGATLGTPLEALGEGFGLMADFLFFFPDGPVDYFELNGNLTYDFPLENSTLVPFVLGGINIARASAEAFGVSVSDTQVGLNLGGGIAFDAGNFRPNVAAKFEVSGGEAFVVWATLPFAVGGDN